MEQLLTPKAFFWRRLHSLAGVWLVLFLIEHLLTNSQAALFIGDNGNGFVRAVNNIHNLPYLPVIEITLLGLPILLHAIWGIKYLLTGEINSTKSDGSRPSLQYPRNRAYTWQRITSWILLFGIIAHVVQMRFMEYPASAQRGDQTYYMTRLSADSGIYTLAERLDVQLYDKNKIRVEKESVDTITNRRRGQFRAVFASMASIFNKPLSENQDVTPEELIQKQEIKQQEAWVKALEIRPLREGEFIAVSPNFGTASLLLVRETFKMPSMIALYTLFVLTAAFHGFNGLWTALITWGVSLTPRAQKKMRMMTSFLMILIAFLGLAAIWGTYWINLRS